MAEPTGCSVLWRLQDDGMGWGKVLTTRRRAALSDVHLHCHINLTLGCLILWGGVGWGGVGILTNRPLPTHLMSLSQLGVGNAVARATTGTEGPTKQASKQASNQPTNQPTNERTLGRLVGWLVECNVSHFCGCASCLLHITSF